MYAVKIKSISLRLEAVRNYKNLDITDLEYKQVNACI